MFIYVYIRFHVWMGLFGTKFLTTLPRLLFSVLLQGFLCTVLTSHLILGLLVCWPISSVHCMYCRIQMFRSLQNFLWNLFVNSVTPRDLLGFRLPITVSMSLSFISASSSFLAASVIFSRPGPSQGLLYKQPRDWFIHSLIKWAFSSYIFTAPPSPNGCS